MSVVVSAPSPAHLPAYERVIPWLAGGLIIGAATLAWQTQYFVDPETALLPWLMSRGWVLYRDIIDQHPPLFPALLALVGGGDPGLPLRLLILALRVVTLGLTYAVARRWAGPGAGLVALVLAEAWLVPFEGTHLWYDGALGPIYLMILDFGFWILEASRLDARSKIQNPKSKIVLVGLLLGIGLLIKQHAVLTLPFVALVLCYPRQGAWARIGWLGLGLALPLLGAGLLLAAGGALDAAWYWLIEYNLTGNYASLATQVPASGEWPLLAALYAPLPAFLAAGVLRRDGAAGWRLRLLLVGLLLAATLPAWPRYGRFHFQAAVPLLAVAGGVAGAELWAAWRAAKGGRRLGAALGLGLVGVGLVIGGVQWVQDGANQRAVLGPPHPIYADTITPLRTWVDAHAPPADPIFIYGLDALLYRVLEREPPRPWAPAKLPWIMLARDTEARFWEGVARARPAIVLVSGPGWDNAPTPGSGSAEALLRYDYQEAARFSVVNYAPAPSVVVVALVRITK